MTKVLLALQERIRENSHHNHIITSDLELLTRAWVISDHEHNQEKPLFGGIVRGWKYRSMTTV